MHDLIDEVASHLRAIWRCRWYAVGFSWLIALAGWTYVYLMPDRYEADTRVFVDTQSVLRPLMKGLAVEPDLDQMVTMMGRTLISRPNLEKVIDMADLGAGIESEDDRIRLIAHLAENLSVSSAGNKNLYTISYVDEDPLVAQKVVASLLKLFVERSRGQKRDDADSARKFIDEQLEGYRKTLTESENAIMDFKRRHLGLLPGEGRTYFARLEDTRTALREAELELSEAENSAEAIRNQLAIAERNAALPEEKSVAKEVEPETELDIRIRALEKKLDELQLRYTDQHPDIVAIVPMIAQLRERKEAETKRLQEEREARERQSGGPSAATRARDPVYRDLAAALTTAESNVAVLRTRVAEYRRRYNELQAAANAVPKVEAEYTQLTRDYEVNKARYDELLKRRESAQISGDLEETDAVMGFRVIDPPRLPVAPSGTNRKVMMTLVLFAAIGGGMGIAWLVGQMTPTVNSERELRELSGQHVLGTVVMAWTDAQKKRRKKSLAVFLASFGSLISAYVGIIAALILTASRV